MKIFENVENEENIFYERGQIFSENPDLDYFLNFFFPKKFQKKYFDKKKYICMYNEPKRDFILLFHFNIIQKIRSTCVLIRIQTFLYF